MPLVRTLIHFLSSMSFLIIFATGIFESGLPKIEFDEMYAFTANILIFLAAGYTAIFVKNIFFNSTMMLASIQCINHIIYRHFVLNMNLNSIEIKQGYSYTLIYCIIGLICSFIFIWRKMSDFAIARQKTRQEPGK